MLTLTARVSDSSTIDESASVFAISIILVHSQRFLASQSAAESIMSIHSPLFPPSQASPESLMLIDSERCRASWADAYSISLAPSAHRHASDEATDSISFTDSTYPGSTSSFSNADGHPQTHIVEPSQFLVVSSGCTASHLWESFVCLIPTLPSPVSDIPVYSYPIPISLTVHSCRPFESFID
jgi:hypothetical protein